MNVYASAISLIQNNCSLLNENYQKAEITITNDINFCEITKFTPQILRFALKFINITGYTGEIYFPEGQSGRARKYSLANPTFTKPYLFVDKNITLYSVHDEELNAVYAGTLTYDSVQIYTSAIQFKNGETPVSGNHENQIWI